MASSSLAKEVGGHCLVNLTHDGRAYHHLRLSVLPDLCSSQRGRTTLYTAFEASHGLYPFGGVSCFQREMSNFVQEEHLLGVFPYMNNITIIMWNGPSRA